MGAVNEQLFGHAAADDAGAADPVLLGDRDLGVMRCRNPRRAHAARSRAYHEQVEIGHQTPALSISAWVDPSSTAESAPSPSSRAISLPSSTPNWSNGLIPSSTALANVRCSQNAISAPSDRASSRSSSTVALGRSPG